MAASVQAPDLGDPLAVDPGVADLAESRLGRAFGSLPERQRAVLWYVVVEGEDPADAAGRGSGVAADDVAGLAALASAALIQASLARYESGLAREDCRAAIAGLGVTADGALRGLDDSAAPHLRACRDCRAAAIELADLSRSLRRTVAPIYLGAAAGAYLAEDTPKPAHRRPSAPRARRAQPIPPA